MITLSARSRARIIHGLTLGSLLFFSGACEASDAAIADQLLAAPTGFPLALTMNEPPRVPDQEATTTLHVHSTFNVRAEPSRASTIVRTLQPGDTVSVGQAQDGWSPVVQDGNRIGYVSRAGNALRAYAPERPSPASFMASEHGGGSASSRGGSRRSSAGGRVYHTGPRGGCYYLTGSNRKQYVDRSYCH